VSKTQRTAPLRCSSADREGVAVAGPAGKRCTGCHSTRTARHSMGQRPCESPTWLRFRRMAGRLFSNLSCPGLSPDQFWTNVGDVGTAARSGCG